MSLLRYMSHEFVRSLSDATHICRICLDSYTDTEVSLGIPFSCQGPPAPPTPFAKPQPVYVYRTTTKPERRRVG